MTVLEHAPTFVPERCGLCGRLTGAVANLTEVPVVLVVTDSTATRKHRLFCIKETPDGHVR